MNLLEEVLQVFKCIYVPHTLPILLNCNNDIIMVDSMANIHGHSRIAVIGDIKLAVHIGWNVQDGI